MSIDTGLYSTITQEQVIASCKFQLKLESSDDDIWIGRLVNEAIRHYDALSIFTKRTCVLDIVHGKSKLPDGFYQLLAIRLNGSTNGLVNQYSLMYLDVPFINSTGNGVSLNNGGFNSTAGVFEIQNGYIIYGSNMEFVDAVTGDVVTATSVQVSFIGLNVDNDGLMCVSSDMERGLIAYVCYMYALQNPEKYPQWLMNEHKMTWINQKKWIQSKDVQNKFENNKRQIASLTNAWINSKSWFI